MAYAVGLLTFRHLKTRVVKALNILYFKITSKDANGKKEIIEEVKDVHGKKEIIEEVELKLKHTADVESGNQKCISKQQKENAMDDIHNVQDGAMARRVPPKSDSGMKYMQILFYYVQDAILVWYNCQNITIFS